MANLRILACALCTGVGKTHDIEPAKDKTTNATINHLYSIKQYPPTNTLRFSTVSVTLVIYLAPYVRLKIKQIFNAATH